MMERNPPPRGGGLFSNFPDSNAFVKDLKKRSDPALMAGKI